MTRVSDGAVVFSAESPNTAGSLASLFNNQGGPWATSWAIPDDAPAGLYTITSTAENRRRVSLTNPCQLEVAVIDTKTIEYRPWQVRFTDVFGGGSVNMNIDPAEFQQRVGTQSGAIWPGAGRMSSTPLPARTSSHCRLTRRAARPTRPRACPRPQWRATRQLVASLGSS